MAEEGLNYEDLKMCKRLFEEKGGKTKLIHLNKSLPKELSKDKNIDDAYVLILRNGVNVITGNSHTANLMYEEQSTLNYDTKYYDTRRKKS